MSDRIWTDWETQRPINAGYYWWRIEPRMIGGMTLQPEWVDELTLCGMGYRDRELWPLFSRWDGYVRSVPRGTQWATKEPTVANDEERWPGVDLLPCPFCCATPVIRWLQRSRDGGSFVGSRPYQANDFMLTCRQCQQAFTRFDGSLVALTNNWNKRAGRWEIHKRLVKQGQYIQNGTAEQTALMVRMRNALEAAKKLPHYSLYSEEESSSHRHGPKRAKEYYDKMRAVEKQIDEAIAAATEALQGAAT